MVVVGDYEVDDDPGRVDRDAVWAFLSEHAYWGRWRRREHVERQLAAAWRVVGVYHRPSGALVGFARVVSDGVALAYLADVYVVPAHRGQGLGTALVRATVEHGPGREFRWLLHTDDAHGLYAKVGFAAPDATLLERPGRRGSAVAAEFPAGQ
uniref:GNAT family N-acetyltransferase n=1 Tax=Goodfellowiella coeruleoviolacea TaxID=334858 RepID=UPI00389948AE